MSATMCSERELTILAAYAVKHCLDAVPYELRSGLDRDGYERTHGAHDRTVDRVFAMLAAENVASIAHLYGKRELTDFSPKPEARREKLPALHIIRACHHYAYQAGEHPAWERCAARNLIEVIEAHAVLNLPGYDDAPWGL